MQRKQKVTLAFVTEVNRSPLFLNCLGVSLHLEYMHCLPIGKWSMELGIVRILKD